MNNTELAHHGVKGMKWGVRKKSYYTPKRGTSSTTKKRKSAVPIDAVSAMRKKHKAKKEARAAEVAAKKARTKRKRVSEMTDEELNEAIRRMDLEKRYKEAVNYHNPNKDRAAKFVNRVLEKSGEQLATQVINHFGAKALNKMIGEEVIFANNKKK